MKKIICPVCGAEYTFQEIFIPSNFMGNITNVNRDNNGKIIDYIGKDMDLKESYRCDYCDCKFNITASIDFICKSPVVDFKKEHKTKLNRPQLKFKED